MPSTASLPVRFFPAVGGSALAAGSETNIYSTPASQVDVVTSVTFNNLTDIAQTVTLKIASNFFAKSLDLPPRSLTVLDFKQVLNTNEIIHLSASNVSAVSCFISGVKITQS